MSSDPKLRRWRLQSGERRLILIIGDLIAASLAVFVALYLWAQIDWFGFSWDFIRNRADWFIYLPAVWLLLMVNNYDVIRAASWRETLRGVLVSGAGGIVLYLLVYFTSEPGSLPRIGVFYFLFLVVVFTLMWRASYIRIFTAPGFLRQALIVGAAESGETIVRVIQAIDPPPYQMVGLIDDDVDKIGAVVFGVPVLGGNTRLLEIIERDAITDLIVAILGPMDGEMFQAILDAQERGIQITRMPVAYEELLGRLPIKHLEADWILRSFVDELRVSTLYTLIKRVLDIFGALVGSFIFLLVAPWVAIAILVESGRPILFVQDRLGQGGRLYGTVKFRTMRQDAESDGAAQWAQESDPRTTKIGALLRKTHLDEFPQFWNVLRGEMSIVGPRPERPELVVELEQQIPFYRARLLTKPGITGWAQVNYGKGASIEGSAEKLEYDLYYIKHRTITMDLWIILRTTGSMIGFKGV
jgi:exopolysaccharide biosynthesis polyprenyl glycosylphosphotransferase